MKGIIGILRKSATKKVMNSDQTKSVAEDIEVTFGETFLNADRNELAMDIYRPKSRQGEILPVVIMVHGGGLFVGTTIMNKGAAERIAREGFVVFVIDYRLMDVADGFQMIEDVCRGMLAVQDRADQYGADVNRTFVVAESAGAFLSIHALKKLQKNDLKTMHVRGFAGISGMFYTNKRDLLGWFYPRQIWGSYRKDKNLMAMMDPDSETMMEGMPPAILTTSDSDFLKRYTLSYHEALRNHGIESTLIDFGPGEHLVHAFPTINPELSESEDCLKQVAAWCHEH